MIGTVLGALYACAVLLSPDEVRNLFLHFKKGKHLLRFPYTVLPPLAAIGAWVGFEAYRLAAGARKPVPLWLIPLILTAIWLPVQFSGATVGLGLEWAFLYGALVMPLLLQFSLRERLITKPSGPNLAWAWCAMYVLMLQPLMARCPGNPLVWSMGVCSYCGLWIADTCLVQRAARLRREGRLTQASNVRFQFSLRSLLIFVLGFGGWLSGLVLFFRI